MFAENIEPAVKEFLESVDTDPDWYRDGEPKEMARECLLENFVYFLEQKELVVPTDILGEKRTICRECQHWNGGKDGPHYIGGAYCQNIHTREPMDVVTGERRTRSCRDINDGHCVYYRTRTGIENNHKGVRQ